MGGRRPWPRGLLRIALASVLPLWGAWTQDVQELARLLKSHDDDVRAEAVRGLARVGSPPAVALMATALEDRDGYVRDLTTQLLGETADAEAIVKAFVPARAALDPTGRAAWAEVFRGLREAYALDSLLEALKDRDARVRERGLLALRDVLASASRPPDGKQPRSFSAERWKAEQAVRRSARQAVAAVDSTTWSRVLGKLVVDRDRFVRAAAVQVCGRLPGAQAVALLERAGREKDPGVRCVLLAQWRHVDPVRARAEAARALAAGSWRERVQAARVLAEIGNEASVAALMEGLAGEPHRRVVAACCAALESLTGMRYGENVQDWNRWWQDHREDYRLPQSPKPRQASRDGGAPRATVVYHGLPVASDRVIFVIDNSGSMRDPMGAGDGDAVTKKDFALEELEKVLAQLGDEARVNVILFADEPQAARKELEPLKGKKRKSLLKWVANISPRGFTNLVDAVLLALQENEATDVYVLSDGAPSAGEHVFRSRVRARIRDRNRLALARIHTVVFQGHAADAQESERLARHRRFMEQIAQDSGGESVVVSQRGSAKK